MLYRIVDGAISSYTWLYLYLIFNISISSIFLWWVKLKLWTTFYFHLSCLQSPVGASLTFIKDWAANFKVSTKSLWLISIVLSLLALNANIICTHNTKWIVKVGASVYVWQISFDLQLQIQSVTWCFQK